MTKSPSHEDRGARRCAWCHRAVPEAEGPGRPRAYCRRSCRQRAYEARRRATELGLGDAELVVARDRLDELGDRLYVLRCATEDVERDLAGLDGPAAARDLQAALDWVLEAVGPVLAWDR